MRILGLFIQVLWVPATPKEDINSCAASPESHTHHFRIVYIIFWNVLWRNAHNRLCAGDVDAGFLSNSDALFSIRKLVALGDACNYIST